MSFINPTTGADVGNEEFDVHKMHWMRISQATYDLAAVGQPGGGKDAAPRMPSAAIEKQYPACEQVSFAREWQVTRDLWYMGPGTHSSKDIDNLQGKKTMSHQRAPDARPT